MKKLLCLLLAVITCVSLLAGCKKPAPPAATDPTVTTDPTTPTTPTTPSDPTVPTVHTHSYGPWQTDTANHWQVCSCGEKRANAPHADGNADETCDACGYAMPLQEAPLATAEQLKQVVAVKTASAGGAITAHPGGRITYQIAITNNSAAAISVDVTDTLPANTLFVSGCNKVSGSALSWHIKRIEPGKTVTVTYLVSPDYTVKQVREAKTDIILKNTAAKVMDTPVAAPTKDIYVLETFNDTDKRRMEMAIDAMVTANLTAYNSSNQQHNTVALASMMYTVGFSTGLGMPTDLKEILTLIYEKAGENTSGGASGTGEENAVAATNLLDRVVPTLFGGTANPASKDHLVRGSRATQVQITDLISGDLLITSKGSDTKLYIVDGDKLVELGITAVTRAIDPATVLPNLPTSDQYVVLRPSVNLNTHYSLENDEFFNDYDKGEYTELEKALIATAETYLLRGDRAQYTDDNVGKGEYRWETAVRQPEDYTVDQYGYSNCAAFTHDVHWATYGVAPKAGYNGNTLTLNTTNNICNTASVSWNPETLTGGNKSTVYYYQCPIKTVNGKVVSLLTDAEKDTIMQQYISLLRPGDIICYRYNSGNSGHAMLYVGNGLIIHSSGSSYSATNKTDTHEATIRFMAVSELFDATISERRYMFTHERFAIVRPQNNTTVKLPENTVNRVTNMDGIIAEKVSSTALGKTVSCGDKVTYTFHIFNTNPEARPVVIADVVSDNATFLAESGNDNWVCDQNQVSLTLTVPADTRISVHYTVQVKDGLAAYTKLDGALATINGVRHKCYDTVVANTLTADQQKKIVDAVNTVKTMDVKELTSVQIANLIYKTAFGMDNIFGEGVVSYADLLNGSGKNNVGIFNDTINYSDASILTMTDANTSAPSKMVAPGLFGGQNVYRSSLGGETFYRYLNLANSPFRSRYFWEKDLVVGDLFLMKATTQDSLYIYIGNDTFVSLGAGHTLFSEQSVSARFGYAPAAAWKYLAVLRPSMALDI